MDELDLVRLARPEADPPDPDALARMKALAFDPSAGTTAVAAPTTDDELVELTAMAPKARHRRRLALVAVAAAVATVGGGLAFATRHSPSGLGTTDTSAATGGAAADAALADALEGRWWIERATLQGKDVTFDLPNAPASRSTAVYADAAGGTFGLLTCDAFTARSVFVRNGRLVLTPAISGESRCADPTARAAQEDMVRLVMRTPKVDVSGDEAVIRSDQGLIRLRRSTAPPNDRPAMADLFGRRFVVDSVVVDGQPVTIGAGELDVADGFTVAVNLGCNLLSAPATIEDGVLVIPSMAQMHAPCTSVFAATENAADALLTSRPTITLAGGSLSIRSGSGELLAHEPTRSSPAATELDGTWRVRAARLGDQEFEFGDESADPHAVIFDVRSGGYSVAMCDTLVGKGFDVPDGRLTLEGTLSGIEAGCGDPQRRRQQDIVVKILTGRPLVEVFDRVATFTAGGDQLTLQRSPSGAAPPTMAELSGRTFRVTSLTKDGRALTISTSAVLAVLGGAQLTIDVGCNTMGGDATIAEGRLTVPSIGSTLKACTAEQNDANAAVMSLLGGPSEISLAGGTLRVAGGSVELLATEMDTPTTPSTTGNG